MKYSVIAIAIAVALGVCLYVFSGGELKPGAIDSVPVANHVIAVTTAESVVVAEQYPMAAVNAPPEHASSMDAMPDAAEWKKRFPSWDPSRPMRENGSVEVRVIKTH